MKSKRPYFELLTPRLRLREFVKADAEGFYRMNADPIVTRYTGDEPFESIASAEAFIECYDHYEKHGMGRWTIERLEDNAYLGFCGLKFHPETQEVDLGFRLIKAYWGCDYATEAALRCLQYGFEELRLKKVIGRADQANLASCRVLEKLGMRKVGPFDFEKRPGWLFEMEGKL